MSPLHDLFREFLCKIKIPFFRPLSDPHIPEIVVNDVGVVEIRPNIEGVVRLQHLADVGFRVSNDCSGKKHAASLAADHTRADHVVPHGKIVLRREMLFAIPRIFWSRVIMISHIFSQSAVISTPLSLSSFARLKNFSHES